MSRQAFPGTTFIQRMSTFVLMTGLLAGCVARPMEGVPPSPNARLYAYLMAHGMARGALMGGRITARNVPKLISLDHDAQKAVLNAMRSQTSAENRKADAAIAALLSSFSS
ncbi:hypothetical protein [Gluconobacter japonicus]|uniref:Lipoprotein n=1 Tax=Gluconobacter japonicus TaxID=376620 RepID=A0ABQ5WJS0_GLUJA|nr:hypothetical protein [Gluconobacter japonicus]KXV28370.1 hypothetical protein AD938_04800 [Gluconobacter japonicus]GBR25364.1 hypothetical protein AA3271_2016 [Gluconobacter japonicus NBRC 3271]GLQ60026.1 hypothetical protein GCM10010937_18290 [Gluconobacter japonicus]